MKASFAKPLKIRLVGSDYQQLRLKILERDAWCCQKCGKREQLEIHHLIRRSQAGDDAEENLIALCHSCHRKAHLRKQ